LLRPPESGVVVLIGTGQQAGERRTLRLFDKLTAQGERQCFPLRFATVIQQVFVIQRGEDDGPYSHHPSTLRQAQGERQCFPLTAKGACSFDL